MASQTFTCGSHVPLVRPTSSQLFTRLYTSGLERQFGSAAKSESANRRKHSLLGLAAFYLGDPFVAQEHFSVVEELSDLFGPFYYGRTYQEYARNEFADLIFEASYEAAERVLQRADYAEAKSLSRGEPAKALLRRTAFHCWVSSPMGKGTSVL